MSRMARVVGIIIVLVALLPSVATAQKSGDMTIGVMAGLSYSTVSQDPQASEVTFSYRPGLVVGGFLGFQVNDAFSIEPQVLYSQKGSNVKGTGVNASLEGGVRIGYIEVPVLGKLWFPISGSDMKPFVFAGPEVEFKVSCTADGAILTVIGSADCNKTGSLIKLKSTDFGATAGAGIQFKAGGQDVRVDARYTLGLSNINDSGDTRNIKNRSFAATVGLGFPLGR